MMKLISGQVMDQERALYGLRDAKVASCRFEGPADGESALKECACLKDQIATIKALGLHKIGQTVVKEDNPGIRGMIFKVKHMVKVEEIAD